MNRFSAYLLMMFVVSALLMSCSETEDPGPLQEVEKEFSVSDFDRLEIGDALHIDVEQGNYFEVSVRGDRRNVDDLRVKTKGSTLVVKFDENRNRRHDTYITITMPEIVSANFSGATDSRISGFYDLASFEFYLSGGSVSQLDITATDLQVVLSGASKLTARGEGETLDANLSGASSLRVYNYPVANAEVNASGASDGFVTVGAELHAIASGASVVRYRGNPSVTTEISGASKVEQD